MPLWAHKIRSSFVDDLIFSVLTFIRHAIAGPIGPLTDGPQA